MKKGDETQNKTEDQEESEENRGGRKVKGDVGVRTWEHGEGPPPRTGPGCGQGHALCTHLCMML